jgi:hypothetical protein
MPKHIGQPVEELDDLSFVVLALISVLIMFLMVTLNRWPRFWRLYSELSK